MSMLKNRDDSSIPQQEQKDFIDEDNSAPVSAKRLFRHIVKYLQMALNLILLSHLLQLGKSL